MDDVCTAIPPRRQEADDGRPDRLRSHDRPRPLPSIPPCWSFGRSVVQMARLIFRNFPVAGQASTSYIPSSRWHPSPGSAVHQRSLR
jgi:hypothetical protein